MRKYLIAALAAVLSIAVAAVAVGQGPASGTVSISPKKAGTKKKPKSIKLKLSVTNETPGTTASRIDVLLPRLVRANAKGLPKCKASTLEAGKKCKAGSKAGGGLAHANIGPHSATPAPLNFKVTAYNGGTNLLLFHLQQVNPQTGVVIPSGVSRVLKGKVSRASGANFYQKIRIGIPEDLQRTAAGYSGLEDFSTSISLKKGKHALLTSVGCKSKQHVLGVVLTFVPNPTPPPRPNASAEASTSCSK